MVSSRIRSSSENNDSDASIDDPCSNDFISNVGSLKQSYFTDVSSSTSKLSFNSKENCTSSIKTEAIIQETNNNTTIHGYTDNANQPRKDGLNIPIFTCDACSMVFKSHILLLNHQQHKCGYNSLNSFEMDRKGKGVGKRSLVSESEKESLINKICKTSTCPNIFKYRLTTSLTQSWRTGKLLTKEKQHIANSFIGEQSTSSNYELLECSFA